METVTIPVKDIEAVMEDMIARFGSTPEIIKEIIKAFQLINK